MFQEPSRSNGSKVAPARGQQLDATDFASSTSGSLACTTCSAGGGQKSDVPGVVKNKIRKTMTRVLFVLTSLLVIVVCVGM